MQISSIRFVRYESPAPLAKSCDHAVQSDCHSNLSRHVYTQRQREAEIGKKDRRPAAAAAAAARCPANLSATATDARGLEASPPSSRGLQKSPDYDELVRREAKRTRRPRSDTRPKHISIQHAAWPVPGGAGARAGSLSASPVRRLRHRTSQTRAVRTGRAEAEDVLPCGDSFDECARM